MDFSSLDNLLENNRQWSAHMLQQDAHFFERLARGQSPNYLWIGCADSRVPANEILGLLPGEVFVHRNIANLLVHTDLNALSVLEYAVEVLKVQHIIVCGHYGCGGVKAAMEARHFGLIDHWLQHIVDIEIKYKPELEKIASFEEKLHSLCELNVHEQVYNVCRTSVVQRAWNNNQPLAIHGLVYDLSDGLLRVLQSPIINISQIPKVYRMALK